MTPERFQEIRDFLKEANAKGMSYWTYDNENEAIEILLAELDRRQEQTRQVLQQALNEQYSAGPAFTEGVNHERRLNNKLIRAAAEQLGITLEETP